MEAKGLRHNSSPDTLREFFSLPKDTECLFNDECEEYEEAYLEGKKIHSFYIKNHTRGQYIIFEVMMCFNKIFKEHNINNKPGGVWFAGDNVFVCYMDKGKHHRPILPATIQYDREGNVIEEQYCLNGSVHNRAGPADRRKNNNVWENNFFLNGKEITLDEFCKRREI